ncbi:hypothetical protein HK101_009662, partial [Irineochytrium annulatum]
MNDRRGDSSTCNDAGKRKYNNRSRSRGGLGGLGGRGQARWNDRATMPHNTKHRSTVVGAPLAIPLPPTSSLATPILHATPRTDDQLTRRDPLRRDSRRPDQQQQQQQQRQNNRRPYDRRPPVRNSDQSREPPGPLSKTAHPRCQSSSASSGAQSTLQIAKCSRTDDRSEVDNLKARVRALQDQVDNLKLENEEMRGYLDDERAKYQQLELAYNQVMGYSGSAFAIADSAHNYASPDESEQSSPIMNLGHREQGRADQEGLEGISECSPMTPRQGEQVKELEPPVAIGGSICGMEDEEMYRQDGAMEEEAEEEELDSGFCIPTTGGVASAGKIIHVGRVAEIEKRICLAAVEVSKSLGCEETDTEEDVREGHFTADEVSKQRAYEEIAKPDSAEEGALDVCLYKQDIGALATQSERGTTSDNDFQECDILLEIWETFKPRSGDEHLTMDKCNYVTVDTTDDEGGEVYASTTMSPRSSFDFFSPPRRSATFTATPPPVDANQHERPPTSSQRVAILPKTPKPVALSEERSCEMSSIAPPATSAPSSLVESSVVGMSNPARAADDFPAFTSPDTPADIMLTFRKLPEKLSSTDKAIAALLEVPLSDPSGDPAHSGSWDSTDDEGNASHPRRDNAPPIIRPRNRERKKRVPGAMTAAQMKAEERRQIDIWGESDDDAVRRKAKEQGERIDAQEALSRPSADDGMAAGEEISAPPALGEEKVASGDVAATAASDPLTSLPGIAEADARRLQMRKPKIVVRTNNSFTGLLTAAAYIPWTDMFSNFPGVPTCHKLMEAIEDIVKGHLEGKGISPAIDNGRASLPRSEEKTIKTIILSRFWDDEKDQWELDKTGERAELERQAVERRRAEERRREEYRRRVEEERRVEKEKREAERLAAEVRKKAREEQAKREVVEEAERLKAMVERRIEIDKKAVVKGSSPKARKTPVAKRTRAPTRECSDGAAEDDSGSESEEFSGGEVELKKTRGIARKKRRIVTEANGMLTWDDSKQETDVKKEPEERGGGANEDAGAKKRAENESEDDCIIISLESSAASSSGVLSAPLSAAVWAVTYHAPPRLAHGAVENVDGVWKYVVSSSWWVKEVQVRRSGPHGVYMLDDEVSYPFLAGMLVITLTTTSNKQFIDWGGKYYGLRVSQATDEAPRSVRLLQRGFWYDFIQFDVNFTVTDGWRRDGETALDITARDLRIYSQPTFRCGAGGQAQGDMARKRVNAEVTISGVTFVYNLPKAEPSCAGGTTESLCVLPVPNIFKPAQIVFQAPGGPAPGGRFVITEQPRLIAFALYYVGIAAAIMTAVATLVFIIWRRKAWLEGWKTQSETWKAWIERSEIWMEISEAWRWICCPVEEDDQEETQPILAS